MTIGNDGWHLLSAVYQADAPSWLHEVPAVDILRRMWIQNFQWEGGQLCWRANDNIPPAAQFISSPYDLDAHYVRKHTTQWVGYKVVLTESCDDDLPQLITNVETTTAPVPDGETTPTIHAALSERELLPRRHIVDTGFLDAALLVESQDQYGVDLFGPTRLDYRWQAREQTGFAAAYFQIDWDQHQATCPEGKRSISWTPSVDHHQNEVIRIKVSSTDCRQCSQLNQCVRSKKRYPRRMLSIRREQQHQALQAARQREGPKAFQQEYDRRAGIEGTLSRGVRTSRLRRTRYIGLERTHLGHLMTAVGLNWLRLGEWLMEMPRAKTRRSPFTRLMASAGAS